VEGCDGDELDGDGMRWDRKSLWKWAGIRMASNTMSLFNTDVAFLPGIDEANLISFELI